MVQKIQKKKIIKLRKKPPLNLTNYQEKTSQYINY